LYELGYPIGRTGVVLTVGPYQLLVADACSGLHSLISMSAMGLLYIYLMGHTSWVRNGILISCLLPIAFAANVVRVMVLVVVTYHFGDEAGQGFIHDFSGIFLFIVGLILLFIIDAALGRVSNFGIRSIGKHDMARP
jgi:exosortase